MEIFKCECGTKTLKKHHTRHLRSKKHLNYINKKEQELEPKVNSDVQESEEEEEETTNQTADIETDTKPVDANTSAEDEDQDEEVIEEIKPNVKKTNFNKFHLDTIRQKAIATIKQKKQAKIDKENEIRYKAEQYDHLVKSLKQKEEDEKKRKEEEKIKEMEYKSMQYDKMVKNQQRNSAITSLSNEKIINDIKEQRLNYLMKYLQNPSYY